MKQNRLFYRNSLLTKLFMLVMLLVGGGNFLNLSAQKTLPYFYGFENNNLAGEGWTTNNLQSGTYNSALYSSSIASHTGNYSFRFYSNENPPQYLISPLLAESENAVVVSLYYKNALSSNTESFCVGYTTVSSTPSTSDFTWDTQVDCKSSTYALYEHSFPANTRYIAIKSTTTTASDKIGNNYYLMIDDITIAEDNPYKTPTDFSLSSFSTTSATFSWTAGNEETSWKFAYSTDSGFTPSTETASSITANPYTISGLTEGTTYYACICADYGDDNYSDWTEKIEFTPSNIVERTINDGSSSLYYVPFYYGGVAPSSGELYKSQFIIPKSSLGFATGRQINKLVFYASTASKSFGNAEFEVYLKETDNNSFSSNAFESWGTCVANSAKFAVNSDKEMTIELNTPFNYSGNKNLMIGFKQTVKGTNASSFSWTGVSATNAGYYYYGTYGNRYSYLPKVTITTVPITTAPVQIGLNGYTTFASTYPLDLTTSNLPSGLKAYKAAVSGTTVTFTKINQTVAANTGVLLEGTAGQTYSIPVAESGTAPEGNEFLVNSTGGTFTAESGYTYFGLLKNSDTNPLVFGVFAPGSVAIPSNKAYLKVADAGEARQLNCVFGGETTGISSLTPSPSPKGEGSVYTLSGQRVEKPVKGLYIVNGKKVSVK